MKHMQSNSAFLGLHPQCVHLAEPSLTLPLEVISDYFFTISRNLTAFFQIESQNFQIKSQIQSQRFKSNPYISNRIAKVVHIAI